jgi:CheY-like chemotaxis protein
MMTMTLEGYGFKVTAATNVTESLKLITTEAFDNVTVTGRELTQREKELCKQISAETNPQVLALVTELNHLLQNQPLQELRIPNAV